MRLNDYSLKPVLDYYTSDHPIDWKKEFSRQAPLVVEIGFGMGEALISNAQNFPDKNFVGIEQHWQRVYRMLGGLDRITRQIPADKKNHNIRVLDIDARVAFERLFPSQTIDHIYCYFPCPWPKKGHVKNRLFSNQFLKLLNNRLKQKGDIKIVTDFYPYFRWIKEEVDPNDFQWQEQVIPTNFQTKYERKWKKEGQEEFFEIVLTKNKHIDVEIKKDVEMQSYKLNTFEPQDFKFEDIKGEVAIVMKDKMYDHNLKRMIIRLIVSEGHLTQNFWVAIYHKNNNWCICRAEGQNIFPTPGIVKALDEVYNAAKNNV